MRVVPPPEMVAYLERLGALEHRTRVAAVAPVRVASALPGAAPSPRRRACPRRPSGAVVFARWLTSLANQLTATCCAWIRALVSTLTVLLVISLGVSPSGAQGQEPASSAARQSAPQSSVIEAEALRLPSIETEIRRLEMSQALRPPTVVLIRQPDWRLLVAAIVGNGGLVLLSLVLFMTSRVRRKVRATVAGVPGWVIRRLCRKPAQEPKPPTARPADADVDVGACSTPPLYRSTCSTQDPSDPLINCWLERLDASLRLKHAAMLPDQVWSTDLRSHRGNVRSRNEDFALGFRFHEHDVVLVADGCGGVPYGFQASRIAACAAALKLVDRWPVKATVAVACEDAMREAFTFASAQLAEAAPIYAAPDDEQALLQTTLIIAVASSSRLTMGYIGDGGAVLVRPQEGTEERILQPMKADGGAQNILAGALGPQTLGEPSIETIERRAGDLLLMGTDGIWDYVPESFSKQLIREAVVRGGRLGETLDAALELLAGHQDDLGHVCTDNLTLAVVAPDHRAPRFGPGFWAAGEPAPTASPGEARQVDEEAIPC